MTDPVGWGVLGAGRITAAAVGPALAASASCRVVAVGSRDRERAARLAEQLHDRASFVPGRGPVAAPTAYGSYEEVVAHPDVQVVYIALANDAHVPWAVAALRAGKHVLCEKPFGLDLDQVRAAFDTADAAGLLAVEAAWNRWHPRTRAAEDLVAAGAIGDVTSVDAGFVFSGVPVGDYRMDPAKGGGALYDVGCYALASAGWATGWGKVTAVEPETRLHPRGVDLAVTGRLEVGGAAVTVRAAIDEPESQWLVIGGTEGRLRFGPPAFTAWAADRAALELGRPDGSVEHRRFDPCDPYALMVEAVAARVRGGRDWVVPRAESEWVAAAIDAVRGRGRPAG